MNPSQRLMQISGDAAAAMKLPDGVAKVAVQ